jgi:hypothetical protein
MLRLARSSSPKRPATDARVVAIGAFRVEYVLYELHVEGRFHVGIVSRIVGDFGAAREGTKSPG